MITSVRLRARIDPCRLIVLLPADGSLMMIKPEPQFGKLRPVRGQGPRPAADRGHRTALVTMVDHGLTVRSRISQLAMPGLGLQVTPDLQPTIRIPA
jgi:hypothetical protein